MAGTLTATCVHHWLLERPDAETVSGRCARCGALRSYPDSIESALRVPEGRASARRPAADPRARQAAGPSERGSINRPEAEPILLGES